MNFTDIENINVAEFFGENSDNTLNIKKTQLDTMLNNNEFDKDSHSEPNTTSEEDPDYYPSESENDNCTSAEENEDNDEIENNENDTLGSLEETMGNFIQQERAKPVEIQNIDDNTIKEAFKQVQQVAYNKITTEVNSILDQDSSKQSTLSPEPLPPLTETPSLLLPLAASSNMDNGSSLLSPPITKLDKDIALPSYLHITLNKDASLPSVSTLSFSEVSSLTSNISTNLSEILLQESNSTVQPIPI